MSRVKRGTTHVKRRRNILKQTKGFRGGRKNLIRHAITAIKKAGQNASAHRRKKKGEMRKLWSIQINAALRASHDMSYSKFIGAMHKKNIAVDRKILSDLANNNPMIFDKVVEEVKK